MPSPVAAVVAFVASLPAPGHGKNFLSRAPSRPLDYAAVSSDRRIPQRVAVPAIPCRFESTRAARLLLVNLSPDGACVAAERVGGTASDELTSAWIAKSPIKIFLNGDSATATVRWARGPRDAEERVLFGLRFTKPILNFADLLRSLLGG
jgi:hypothetical protein